MKVQAAPASLATRGDQYRRQLTEEPHKDTRALRVPTFKRLNRFCNNDLAERKDATAENAFELELWRAVLNALGTRG